MAFGTTAAYQSALSATATSSLRFRILNAVRTHPLPYVMAALGVVMRLFFEIYTHRIWEDALITLVPARNAWEGFGLTHHVSEPRVESFTSPISILIPLVGEAFRQGLLALQISAVVGFVVAVYYAYRICLTLRLAWYARFFLLSFLAFDQLQVFFGMTGMETQVVTAIALANAYYLLSSQWWKLGFATGAGLLGRPEFAFWLPLVGLATLLIDWKQVSKVVLGTLLVGGPWYLFATIYYGSPIPNTIVAKSGSGRNVVGAYPLDQVWQHLLTMWKSFSPFYEMAFAWRAPLPNWFLIGVVLVMLAAFIVGLAAAALNRNIPILAVGLFVVVFLLHQAFTLMPLYFMWYVPPFMALAVVVALHWTKNLPHWMRAVGACVCLSLSVLYALPTPWSMPIEKARQIDIEDGVRIKASIALNALMSSSDTASMEPLGYTGWAARNKTIYDFPGLGSKVAVRALKDMQPYPSLEGLIDKLQPTFALLRPQEYQQLREMYPRTAENYSMVEDFKARPGVNLAFAGYEYEAADAEFQIYRHK